MKCESRMRAQSAAPSPKPDFVNPFDDSAAIQVPNMPEACNNGVRPEPSIHSLSAPSPLDALILSNSDTHLRHDSVTYSATTASTSSHSSPLLRTQRRHSDPFADPEPSHSDREGRTATEAPANRKTPASHPSSQCVATPEKKTRRGLRDRIKKIFTGRKKEGNTLAQEAPKPVKFRGEGNHFLHGTMRSRRYSFLSS